MFKRSSLRLSVLAMLLFLLLPGLALAGRSSDPGRDVLFQYSTLPALAAGMFEGGMTVADLKQWGDTGLGTFLGLNGEMVVVDGEVYQVTNDGKVHVAAKDQTIPFATVTFFDTDAVVRLERVEKLADLTERVAAALPGKNAFYALRIRGDFSHIQARSVPAQKEPYPTLADVLTQQSVFALAGEQAKGVCVGFYGPDWLKGATVPGFHIHYLSDAKDAGGHVLDLAGNNVVVEIDLTPALRLDLPTTPVFLGYDFPQGASDASHGAAKE